MTWGLLWSLLGLLVDGYAVAWSAAPLPVTLITAGWLAGTVAALSERTARLVAVVADVAADALDSRARDPVTARPNGPAEPTPDVDKPAPAA